MIDPSPAGTMMVETLASTLGVHVLRHHSNLASASVSLPAARRRGQPARDHAPLPAARGALDSRRLRRVKEFIETHLGDNLTVEALADEACLSPFHFARAFKTATGTTPHGYLTERRLDEAKSLIAEERLALAEIACRCGFSSQASFTTWFRRVTGGTPGAYRQDRL